MAVLKAVCLSMTAIHIKLSMRWRANTTGHKFNSFFSTTSYSTHHTLYTSRMRWWQWRPLLVRTISIRFPVPESSLPPAKYLHLLTRDLRNMSITDLMEVMKPAGMASFRNCYHTSLAGFLLQYYRVLPADFSTRQQQLSKSHNSVFKTHWTEIHLCTCC